MPSITVQGYKFDVPEGIIAKFAVGYTLASEGEAHALRQTFLENLRNNFAPKVKAKMGDADHLPDGAFDELASAFNEYAGKYEFGVRSGGGGGRRIVDPVEREMVKLAKGDIGKAYEAKYGEKITKDQRDWLDEKVEELLEKRHDDYAKRARAIIRQRESSAESVGIEL